MSLLNLIFLLNHLSLLSLSFPSHPHSNKSSSSLKLYSRLNRWYTKHSPLLLKVEVQEGCLNHCTLFLFSSMCVSSFCFVCPRPSLSRLLLSPCPYCLLLLLGIVNCLCPLFAKSQLLTTASSDSSESAATARASPGLQREAQFSAGSAAWSHSLCSYQLLVPR